MSTNEKMNEEERELWRNKLDEMRSSVYGLTTEFEENLTYLTKNKHLYNEEMFKFLIEQIKQAAIEGAEHSSRLIEQVTMIEKKEI
ncbi:hypothetical protein J2Z69_000763 [Paenibacillus shirakamiensis]|uniref:PH domain-containing protein n=1 Tax=Paenibacillus shirakamiensis TaxID=1265935 RepID=A0ABS4JDG5_9BACL|nr:hypothetical protein [Paenibacillus shirakamiensis]MBP1999744.1 hypothetical protein [Paenibacillus shirakamiensis]